MPWWGWLLLAATCIGGVALLCAGGYMEQGHRLAELGSALRRDTPAFGGSHPTSGHVSMCIGCGQTDNTHVDRFGSPCPYSYTNVDEYLVNTTEAQRREFTENLLREHGFTKQADGDWMNR